MLVYLIVNNVNGKRYVGQTSQPLNKRWARHRSPMNHRDPQYLFRAIQKYGAENFTIKPLVVVNSKWEMDLYERSLIKAFGLRNPEKGYNLTDGGGGMLGFKLSEETKARMSSYVKSEEHRARISISKLGNKSRLGILHSEETKKKISEAHKGKKFSSEHLNNLRLARRRRTEREQCPRH